MQLVRRQEGHRFGRSLGFVFSTLRFSVVFMCVSSDHFNLVLLAFVALSLVSSAYEDKTQTGKTVSEMTYFVSNHGT